MDGAPERVLRPNHRVHRLTVDLRYADEETAFRWRAEARQLVEEVAIPALEESFDALTADGQILQVSRLELDLGSLPDFVNDRAGERRALAQRIRAQISKKLHAAAFPTEPSAEPKAGEPQQAQTGEFPALVEALIHFLQFGRLPWNAPFVSLSEAEAAVVKLHPPQARQVAARLLEVLASANARRRFALQLAPETAVWVVRAVLGTAAESLLEAGRASAAVLGEEAWVEALLESAIALAPDAPLSPEDAAQIWKAATEPPAVQKPAPKAVAIPQPAPAPESAAGSATQVGDDAIYVVLAGIVLLHPFLARFFGTLGLVEEGGVFVSFAAQERALHLLHFLATGKEEPEEHETLLLKLLCGLPGTLPIARRVALSELERSECDNLLNAVISHWSKLGNSSVGALRETFLQREGKLERLEVGWRLTVEQRSLDILLGWLPWGLSIVRLPWMAQPLWVDWA